MPRPQVVCYEKYDRPNLGNKCSAAIKVPRQANDWNGVYTINSNYSEKSVGLVDAVTQLEPQKEVLTGLKDIDNLNYNAISMDDDINESERREILR